jgi:hypothetical protein
VGQNHRQKHIADPSVGPCKRSTWGRGTPIPDRGTAKSFIEGKDIVLVSNPVLKEFLKFTSLTHWRRVVIDEADDVHCHEDACRQDEVHLVPDRHPCPSEGAKEYGVHPGCSACRFVCQLIRVLLQEREGLLDQRSSGDRRPVPTGVLDGPHLCGE